MRSRLLLVVPILAVAAAACRKDAPTATRSSEMRATPARSAATRLALGSVTIPPVGGFVSTLLARGSFSDPIDLKLKLAGYHGTNVVHVNEMKDMVMSRITIEPNRSLPWHSHPGPAFVTVTAGKITLMDGDSCEARTYVVASRRARARRG